MARRIALVVLVSVASGCTLALPFADRDAGGDGGRLDGGADAAPDAGDADVGECGNGLVEGQEECDDGVANSDVTSDACRTSCRLPACGDGVIDSGEQCDDGGTDDGDGCSAGCLDEICSSVAALLAQVGCGPGEACDLDTQNMLGCRSAGATPGYSPCGQPEECEAGAGCHEFGLIDRCQPYCPVAEVGNPGGCPNGGVCLRLLSTTEGPGGLCARPDPCDVVDQTGCSGGNGCYVVFGETFCLPPGPALPGSVCAPLDNECVAGYYCDGICRRACHDSGDCTLEQCTGVTGHPNTGFCE